MPGSSRPPPEAFGKYLLDEEIGRGGMARVYRARLRGLGGFEKTLVVKQVLPELAGDPLFVRMFVDEAKALVQMSHPHLVPVYELGVVDGTYFLAMEYVAGATLGEMLREGGALTPAAVAHVGAQVADALHYAHRRFGLVHRDVSAGNVIVDGQGHARLLDFGISATRATDGNGAPAFGTPGYASPEQRRRGAQDIGHRSDLFGLGVVLREALTGDGPTATGRTEPGPPLAAIPGIPAALAAILDPCAAAAPNDRPESADLVTRDLRAWLGRHHPEDVAEDLGARAEATRRARESRRRRRRRERRPGRSDPSGAVRSLATSPALEAVLGGAEPPSRIGALPPAADERPSTLVGPVPGPAKVPREALSAARTRRLVRGGRRRRRLLAGAVLVGVLGAGIGLAVLGRPAPRPGADPGAESDPGPSSTRLASRGGAEGPVTADERSRTAVPDGPAGEPPPAQDRADGEGASGDAVRAGRPAGQPESGSARSGTGPENGEPAPGDGVLVVTAMPWAEVAVDGRPAGTTPLRSLSLAPGDHVVELRCPPLGREDRVRVTLDPGERWRVVSNLETSPPQTEIRQER